MHIYSLDGGPRGPVDEGREGGGLLGHLRMSEKEAPPALHEGPQPRNPLVAPVDVDGHVLADVVPEHLHRVELLAVLLELGLDELLQGRDPRAEHLPVVDRVEKPPDMSEVALPPGAVRHGPPEHRPG